MARRKRTLGVRMKTRIPSADQVAKSLGVDKDGKLQNYVTDVVLENIVDYIPKRSGELIGDTRKNSSTTIKVESPYAAYMFFGVSKSGQPLNYSKLQNPNAGPHWDSRMIAERGKKIAQKIRRFAGNRATRKGRG